MELNVMTAPKTGTFQMRINSEIKEYLESIFAETGLSLTDAVDVFFQQSINAGGLPFLASSPNEAYLKAKAASMLIVKLQKGIDSAAGGVISEEEISQLLSDDE